MPSQLTESEKNMVTLAAFVGYLMVTTKCSQAEALVKVADLCVAVQESMRAMCK